MCVSPASKLLLWLSLLMDFLFAVNLHPTLSKGDMSVSLPLFPPSCLRILTPLLFLALSERPLLCGRRIYWTSLQNLSVMDSLCKWGGWLQHQHFITQSKDACVYVCMCVCVCGGAEMQTWFGDRWLQRPLDEKPQILKWNPKWRKTEPSLFLILDLENEGLWN